MGKVSSIVVGCVDIVDNSVDGVNKGAGAAGSIANGTDEVGGIIDGVDVVGMPWMKRMASPLPWSLQCTALPPSLIARLR